MPERVPQPSAPVGTKSLEHEPASDALRAGPTRPRRVLLATDLSPASEAATEKAISLAIEHQAELIVLTVVDPGRLRLPGGLFLRRVDQERSRVEAGVQRVVARARSAGARATFLVWEGDPAETIMAASEAEGADVIVVGSRGRGRLVRLLLGSTSHDVAEDARRPVIVMTRP